MNKTNIEWCGYTINPVKGLCPVDCKDNQGKSYCYARRMYKRFKWNPELDFDASVFNDLPKMKPGSKVFWGSTFELFWEGEAVMAGWMRFVFEAVKRHPELTHIFLTKRPENLIKWSPFPPNCWVGVSATLPEQIRLAFKYLHYGVQAKVKFVSFEPMLGMILPFESKWFTASGVNWVIIGQQTPVSLKTMPKIGWVEDIINAADKVNIPIFLKDNLISCVDQYAFALKDGKYRQELPII